MTAPKRPAAFDAKVMSHMPMLRKQARKRGGDRWEELLQDTLLGIFEKWQNFRGDISKTNSGFASWLIWQMRSAASNHARLAFRSEIEDVDGRIAGSVAVPPRQEDITFANQICRRLSRTREGRILMRFGTGAVAREIAASRRISTTRVDQLASRARAKLPVAA